MANEEIFILSSSTGHIIKIYQLYRGDDSGRGQSEDDDAVGRLECGHQSPPFINDYVAVPKGVNRDR